MSEATEGAVASVLLLAVLALGVAPAGAAQLPPSIQADRLLVQAEREIGGGDYAAAVATFERILALQEEHGLPAPPVFWFKYAQVLHQAERYDAAVESVTRYLVEAGASGEHYREALELLDALELAASLEGERLRRAAEVSRLAPGETFRDPLSSGGEGPELVVIPAGSFRMGCVSGVECRDAEHPVHQVTLPQPFAVGKYEVTFGEWDACVSAGGCGHSPADRGWGRGGRPVMNVSWDDAQPYVRWLSQQTGASYRLLSESEWEYAARAGSRTAYSWGNEIGSGRANCGGSGSLCVDSQTAPVGSFSPNGFGLHDMHGNVWEWVQDCWNESYSGAPSDGSAWQSGDCSRRVLRGGSWGLRPWYLRSAYRARFSTDFLDSFNGFRVARTLSP